MADSISVVMKMTDDVTGPLKSIASTAKGCSKELETLQRQAQQLGQRYTDMNKKAAETSAKALSVKKAMGEARKAFKATGDESDRVKFENLKSEYDDLTYAAKGYATAAKETVKDMNNVAQAARKLAGGNSDGFFSSLFTDELRNGLMHSGLIQNLGASFSGIIGARIESAIGQPIATALRSVTSGALSGIAAGVFAGIPGMVFGGLTGAASGALSAYTQMYEANGDPDTFRREVRCYWLVDARAHNREEDEDMTQEQFDVMMENWLARQAEKPAYGWAAKLLAEAKARGITDGTRPQSYATRQEVALMVNAAAK